MIEPGICAGLDGDETVRSMFVCQGATRTTEVGIKRRGMLVLNMPIPPGGVGLPNLAERVGAGPPVTVEHASAYDDALAQWLTCVLPGWVVILPPDLFMPKDRAGNLRGP